MKSRRMRWAVLAVCMGEMRKSWSKNLNRRDYF
jgi:hypothetical protein